MSGTSSGLSSGATAVPDLVGMDDDLAVVRGLLADSRGGTTRALLVEGDPGTGKTTLLAAAEDLAAGFRRLRSRGSPSEQVLPHAGLLQLLLPLRDRVDALPEAQAAALRSALGWGAGPAAVDRFLVGAATMSLLAAVAEEQPVLVLVDDLPWLDRESAAAVTFAARRLADDRVCVLLTGRTGEVPADLVQGIPVLTRRGLTAAEGERLLGDRVAAAVARRLVALTGGNPLALREVTGRLTTAQRLGAAALPDPLPVGAGLARLYEPLVRSLSPPALRAALLWAVDLSGSTAVVGAALQQDGTDAGPAVDEAVDAGVLTPLLGRFGFPHPLVRTAVLALASPADLRDAHRRLAAVLADDPASSAAVWHRAASATGPDPAAARALVAVAVTSRARQGHAAASEALERAATLTVDGADRAGWLATAAEDAFVAGDVVRTRTLAERVLDGGGPAAARGRALVALGTSEQYAGSLPRAAELLASAVGLATGVDQAWARVELALVRFRLDDLPGVVACALDVPVGEGLDDALRHSDASGVLADFVRGFAATVAGDHAEGRRLLRRFVDGLDVLGDDPRALLLLGLASGFLGDVAAAIATGEPRLRAARERGAVGVLVPVLAIVASGRAWAGDHRGAFADAAEAVDLGEQLGYVADVSVALEMLAWQSASRGLHDDAGRALDRARDLVQRAGAEHAAAHHAVTAAFCALCRGDAAGAAVLLEARIAADGGTGTRGEPLGVAPDLVEAYVRLGRDEEARALAERFAAVTPPAAPAWTRALVARCRALTARDEPTATQAFELALAAHVDAADPFETARTRLLLGERLRRHGRRVAAREHLRAAQASFAAMDLSGWLRRAEEELLAAGAAASPRRPDEGEALTAQETRVAVEAARGRSNQEIAAALFVSPKTVERHLSNIYRKRGLRSRTQLAVAFRAENG